MKKVLVVVVVIVGLFLALKKWERMTPDAQLPPPPPPPPPVEVQQQPQQQQNPVVQTPVPVQQAPVQPTQQAGRNPALDGLLATVDRLRFVPDPDRLNADCMASPRDKIGEMPKQEPTAETRKNDAMFDASMKVFCANNLSACAQFQGSSDPMSPFKNKSQCLDRLGEFVYLKSVIEGRPDLEQCRLWLTDNFGRPLKPEEVSTLCRLKAEDFRTGGDAYQKEAARMYGESNAETVPTYFAQGPARCIQNLKAGGERDSCVLKAILKQALESNDPNKCVEITRLNKVSPERDLGYCLAMAGDGEVCSGNESAAEVVRRRGDTGTSPEWVAANCSAWAVKRIEDWVRDVDANGQFVLDQLNVSVREVDRLSPSEKAYYAPKLDKGIDTVKAAVKEMEKTRQLLMRGKIRGQGAPRSGQ